MVQVHARLLEANWPAGVYYLPGCAEERDANGRRRFAGLRVRLGISWAAAGSVVALYNKRSKTFQMRGPSMDVAVAVSDAANGGQTILTHHVQRKARNPKNCDCWHVPLSTGRKSSIDAHHRALRLCALISQALQLRSGPRLRLVDIALRQLTDTLATAHSHVAVQLLDELPEAGFPCLRHLGEWALPLSAYTGHLYEICGQAFAALDRTFATPVRDAHCVSPTLVPVAAPLPPVFAARFQQALPKPEPPSEAAAPAGQPTIVCCVLPLPPGASHLRHRVRCLLS